MRHCKRDAVGSELPVDESERCGIAAARAIDASYLIATDGELVHVRITGVGSPPASVVIGILGCGYLRDTEHGN
jgi:hypothetical protein